MKYWLLICLAWFGLILSAGTVTLAEHGHANTQIVVGKNPPFVVRYAARELADFLGRIGRCTIPIVAESDAPVRIYLGDSTPARAAGWQPERGKSLLAIREDGTILLAGLDDPGTAELDVATLLLNIRDRGTLEATYTFLEKYCGVRWTEPGKDGEFVPGRDVFTLPTAEEMLTPAFTDRRMYHFDGLSFPDIEEYGGREGLWQWALRMRSASWCEPVFGCHPGGQLKLKENFAAAHPDYFALQPNGKRNFMYLCWTNPDVIDFWVRRGDAYFSGVPSPESAGIHMSYWPGVYGVNPARPDFLVDPYDMYETYVCQCGRCKKFMAEHPDNGLSELIWRAIIEVANRLKQKYPDKIVSTLAYPPKQLLPRDTPIPDNLQVRLTAGGPNQRIGAPDMYQKQLALLRDWQAATRKPVPLWIYINNTFGNGMTGAPEILPHEFREFLRDVRPWSNGMFVEYSQANHTIANMDIYAMFHLLWDPEQNPDALLDEYCRIQYGDAGPAMRDFFARLEDNWRRILELTWTRESTIHAAWHTSDRYRRTMWEEVYTPEEIARLESMLDEAMEKIPSSGIYARRINRVRRYVIDFIKNERAGMMADSAGLRMPTILCVGTVDGIPSERDWELAPWLPLVSADGKEQFASGRVKLLAGPENFHIRAEFADPEIARSKTPERSGDDWDGIWEDNEAELFFYSEASGVPVQILINDRGFAVIHRLDDTADNFRTDVTLPVRAERNSAGWSLEATIPHTVSGLRFPGDNRFNLIRTRNVESLPTEYSTLIPDARKGKWMQPNYYGNIHRIPLKNVTETSEYRQLAAVPAGNATPIYSDNLSTPDLNSRAQWVNPGGKSHLAHVADFGHAENGALLIDMSLDRPEDKDPGAVWLWTQQQPAGQRLRIRLWFYAETSRPDARLVLGAGFQDASRRWIRHEELCGSVMASAQPGTWQELSLDITVPAGEHVEYLVVTGGSENACPGKIYLDDLTVEKVSEP